MIRVTCSVSRIQLCDPMDCSLPCSSVRGMFNMLHCIEAAGYIGIKHAVIHPKGDHRDSHENYDKELTRNIEYMTPYVEQAEKYGVKLAFENMRSPLEAEGFHRNFSTADELIPLADHFGHGICWDFGHAHTTSIP